MDNRINKSSSIYFCFFITEENNKFELYADTFGEFLFEELKDELDEILSISDITSYHLEHRKKDRVLLKHIRNEDQKALMDILYF